MTRMNIEVITIMVVSLPGALRPPGPTEKRLRRARQPASSAEVNLRMFSTQACQKKSLLRHRNGIVDPPGS
eukprot:7577340-Alexandrium_andersonii.AAC.1